MNASHLESRLAQWETVLNGAAAQVRQIPKKLLVQPLLFRVENDAEGVCWRFEGVGRLDPPCFRARYQWPSNPVVSPTGFEPVFPD